MKILLISGHKNITDLTKDGLRSWRDVTSLRRSTGASGEMSYQWDKIAPELKEKLSDYYEVEITDAIYHKDIYDKEYDLCLALHYDGGGTENRCMASTPDANVNFVNDRAIKEGNRFIELFKGIYPETTGTIYRENRVTIGMTQYYCWDYINENTPSVIIEEFNHTSERGTFLKNNPDLIVEGIFKTVLAFFGDSSNECEEKLKKAEERGDYWKKEARDCRSKKEQIEEDYVKEVKSKNEQIESLLEQISLLNEQATTVTLQYNSLQKEFARFKDKEYNPLYKQNETLNIEHKKLKEKFDKAIERIEKLEQSKGLYSYSWQERLISLFKGGD